MSGEDVSPELRRRALEMMREKPDPELVAFLRMIGRKRRELIAALLTGSKDLNALLEWHAGVGLMLHRQARDCRTLFTTIEKNERGLGNSADADECLRVLRALKCMYETGEPGETHVAIDVNPKD